MAVDERRRIALHGQVAAAWGEEAAETLFELLIPPGEDPATRQDLRAGFDEVDRRFEQVERRLDGVDQRLDGVDQRLDGVDQRLDGVDRRLDLMTQRFDEVEHRFDALRLQLDARFSKMSEHFERRIADAVTAQTRTLVFTLVGSVVAIAALAFGLQ